MVRPEPVGQGLRIDLSVAVKAHIHAKDSAAELQIRVIEKPIFAEIHPFGKSQSVLAQQFPPVKLVPRGVEQDHLVADIPVRQLMAVGKAQRRWEGLFPFHSLFSRSHVFDAKKEQIDRSIPAKHISKKASAIR